MTRGVLCERHRILENYHSTERYPQRPTARAADVVHVEQLLNDHLTSIDVEGVRRDRVAYERVLVGVLVVKCRQVPRDDYPARARRNRVQLALIRRRHEPGRRRRGHRVLRAAPTRAVLGVAREHAHLHVVGIDDDRPVRVRANIERHSPGRPASREPGPGGDVRDVTTASAPAQAVHDLLERDEALRELARLAGASVAPERGQVGRHYAYSGCGVKKIRMPNRPVFRSSPFAFEVAMVSSGSNAASTWNTDSAPCVALSPR